MSDWRAELARDGITSRQKRLIFDILAGGSEISLKGIVEGLTNRGMKRVTKSKIRKYLVNEPKIMKKTDIHNRSVYKSVE